MVDPWEQADPLTVQDLGDGGSPAPSLQARWARQGARDREQGQSGGKAGLRPVDRRHGLWADVERRWWDFDIGGSTPGWPVRRREEEC